MPASVDDYIDGFPPNRAARLTELRELITAVLPEAREEIKWSTPAYSTGTVLVTFAGYSNHLNLYFTPSTIRAFHDSLADYRTGKSALSLPYDSPLPRELITDLLVYRRQEFDRDGITWM